MNTLLHWSSRLAAVVFLAMPGETTAQASPPAEHPVNGPRVPVTVALTDELPDSTARYLILREPARATPDIILLPADADERTLSEAIHSLLAARRNGRDVPAIRGMLRARRSADQDPVVLPWATRVLNDVRSAIARPVDGIGTVRSVEIWLPRQSGRG